MRALFRKFLILVAAYALALQPAFAAMSAAHVRTIAELCSSEQRSDVPAPAGAHDDDNCCLALGCNAPAGAGPALVANVIPAFAVTDARLGVPPAPSPTRWPNERPHSARAPPV